MVQFFIIEPIALIKVHGPCCFRLIECSNCVGEDICNDVNYTYLYEVVVDILMWKQVCCS
jgi:hypothetical protein